MDTRNVFTLLVLGLALSACTGDNSSSSSGGSSGTSGDPSSSAASGTSGSQSASPASASTSSGGNSSNMNASSSGSGTQSGSGQMASSSNGGSSSGTTGTSSGNMGTLAVWIDVPGNATCEGPLGTAPGMLELTPGPYSLEVTSSPSAVPLRLSDFEDVTVVAGQMVSFHGGTEANPHKQPVDLSHGSSDLVGCWQNQGDGSSVTLTTARETRAMYLSEGRWRVNGLVNPFHIDGFELRWYGSSAPDGHVETDGNTFSITDGGGTYTLTFQHPGSC